MSPTRLDRAAAVARIESSGDMGCVPCALARSAEPLAENDHAVAVLSRYPVRWGHTLIVLRQHLTSLDAVSPEIWAGASALAHASGRALERALAPNRCYVAALGTGVSGLPMSFPHLHLHVIPVAPDARPSEVLTWRDGVFDGTTEEWAELRGLVLGAWPG